MANSVHSSNPSPSNHGSDPFSTSSPYVPIDATSRASSAAKRRINPEQYQPPEKKQRQSTTTPNPARYAPALPPGVWQRVFSHLPPETLARVLRVSHDFNALLTGDRPSEDEDSGRGAALAMDPEQVWATSRLLHHHEVPRPLAGRSELDMWKLIRGHGCTICDEPYPFSSGGFPFEAGPHNDSVRIIWPFAIRCCRACLREGSQTDESLLLSDASAVIPTLPFAFITKKHHIVSSAVLQSGTQIPPTLEIRKIYYTKNVEEMQSKLEIAREVSISRAKERFEELKAQKLTRLRDVDTWERWEQHGGMKSLVPPMTPPILSRPGSSHPSSKTPTWSSSRPSSNVNPVIPRSLSRPHQTPGKDRDFREIQETKASRRHEIEQRCRELDPPLSPSLLERMDSFQAAIQISTPLSARDWEVLKPRLLSQRSVAERRVSEEALSHSQERRTHDLNVREVKEASDRQWEDAQLSIREQIGEYADEIIRNEWAEGDTIDISNAPQFAADVLLHVRKRFNSDMYRENRVKTDATSSKILVLDDLKWVYDTKVKPHAEKFRKDLFLCSVCGQSGKTFPFDGVIQHYGAKHTNEFSLGDTVVHWRAGVWPETPPFAPFPEMRVPSGHNRVSTSGHNRRGSNYHPSQSQQPFYVPTQGPFGFPGMHPNVSPGPYGNMSFPNAQDTGQFGPFQPPVTYYNSQQLMQHDPRSYSPVFNQLRGQTPGQQMSYSATSPAPHTPYAQSGWPAPAFDNGFSSPAQGGMMMPPPGYGRGFVDSSVHPTQGNSYSLQGTGSFYQEQLEYLAYIANDVWTILSPVESMLSNVRLFVIIHHVVSKFSSRFSNEPSLDLFYECLNKFPSLTAIKSVNDLACKACVLKNESSPEPHSISFNYKTGERRLYPFLSLLSHFKAVHLHVQPLLSSDNSESKSPVEKLDWKEDMIELPNDSYIEALRTTPGMDDEKFQYIARSFPQMFRLHISTMSETRGQTNASSNRSSPSITRKRERKESEDFVVEDRSPSTRRRKVHSPSPQSPSTARDDEYDPRRPAFMGGNHLTKPKPPMEMTSNDIESSRQVSRAVKRGHPISQESGHEISRMTRNLHGDSTNEMQAERFLAEFTPGDEGEFRRRVHAPEGHAVDRRSTSGRRDVRVAIGHTLPRDDRYIVLEGPPRHTRDERSPQRGGPEPTYEVQSEETNQSRPIYIRAADSAEVDRRYRRPPYERAKYYEDPIPSEPVEYIYVRRRDGAVYRPDHSGYGDRPDATWVSKLGQEPLELHPQDDQRMYIEEDEELLDAPPPPRSTTESRH